MSFSAITIFIIMITSFALFVFLGKRSISISLILAAILGSLLSGKGVPIRHLVEGTFGYIDTILIITIAMIFMRVIQKTGLLATIANSIIIKFKNKPIILLLLIMLLIMFPGMITGSSTAAVLTTGAMVAPVLIYMGFSKQRAAAFIALGAIYGMIAPPVNVPAMIIGGGIDMPYIGFTFPLLLASLPLAFVSAILLGYKYINKLDIDNKQKKLPNSYLEQYGIKIFTPVFILIILMLAQNIFPQVFPNFGLVLIFLLSSLSGLFTGKKFNFFVTSKEAVNDALPVLGILMGVGIFIQIMTLTGARGAIVLLCLSVPSYLLYLGAGVSLPLFGAISSYGSASVLGVPFILAFLGNNEIVTGSALSLISGLGDLMPPTALAGMFAAQVVNEKNYFKVLKNCIWPGIMTIGYGIFLIINANLIDKLLDSVIGKSIILTIIFTSAMIIILITKLILKIRGKRVKKNDINTNI